MKKAAAPPPPAAKPRKPAPASAELVSAALADQGDKKPPRPKKPKLGPDGQPLPPEPVEYTAPAAVRKLDWRARLSRDLTTAIIVVIAADAAFLSPPGQTAYAAWKLRHMIDGLNFTTINGAEIGTGSVQLQLPDGSTGVKDQTTGRTVYRFAHDLDLGKRGNVHVAFDLTGYPAGLDDALQRGQKLSPRLQIVQETHHGKKFKVVSFTEPKQEGVDHPGQRACFYQLADRDENFFSMVLHYDEAGTDPKAMALVLDHVLGSLQE